MKEMKVAIVHDWLTNFGGAERVVLMLHDIFPDAPIYTTVYDNKNMKSYFGGMDVRTSFLQKLPGGVKHYKAFLPFMPAAFEDFDLKEYDLVISSSSSCAKGVRIGGDTMHICYCHTPMRYAWDMYNEYVGARKLWKRVPIALFMNYIRLWDRVSSDRVDYFLANSAYVAKRIQKQYHKKAKVIYPGVNTDYYQYNPRVKREDFYLVVSRLVPYKKVDLAVRTFNELGKKLVIIGGGPEERKLRQMAGANIVFLGKCTDKTIRQYYQRARALIFSADEDFGIVPVEAQSCGLPVIAYKKGGVLETVADGQTGIFYGKQTTDSLKRAVLKMEQDFSCFEPEKLREHALKFSKERFCKEIAAFIEEKVKNR